MHPSIYSEVNISRFSFSCSIPVYWISTSDLPGESVRQNLELRSSIRSALWFTPVLVCRVCWNLYNVSKRFGDSFEVSWISIWVHVDFSDFGTFQLEVSLSILNVEDNMPTHKCSPHDPASSSIWASDSEAIFRFLILSPGFKSHTRLSRACNPFTVISKLKSLPNVKLTNESFTCQEPGYCSSVKTLHWRVFTKKVSS